MELEIGDKPYRKVLATEDALENSDKNQRESRSLALEQDIKLTYSNRKPRNSRYALRSDAESSSKKTKRDSATTTARTSPAASTPTYTSPSQSVNTTYEARRRERSEDTVQGDFRSTQDPASFSFRQTSTMATTHDYEDPSMQLQEQMALSSNQRLSNEPRSSIWDIPPSPEPAPEHWRSTIKQPRLAFDNREVPREHKVSGLPTASATSSTTSFSKTVPMGNEDADEQRQKPQPTPTMKGAAIDAEVRKQETTPKLKEEPLETVQQQVRATSRGKARRGGIFRPGIIRKHDYRRTF
ncbi:hypothetical protein PVAG01_00747 [Phlyctema vagabunda]|uniref:Uncharacterized protein n=1 Tax=Phlyctema vagabunda TaxID=108571 RepID=A0ABR4PVK4_9HELO